MFLSKRNGIYYLWYTDCNGKKQKISTRTSRKREAVRFLDTFQPEDPPERNSTVLLSNFTHRLFDYVRASIDL